MNQKGVAMVTAIVLALVVSAMAAVVLSLTMRRFELSAFRTDHAVAAGTSEAGFQYAFARLAVPAFRTLVDTKRTSLGPGAVPANDLAAEYVISCHDDPAITEDQILDPDGAGSLQQAPALHMGGVLDATVIAPPATTGGLRGGKHVTVRIRYFTAADITAGFYPAALAARPYRVRSSSNFGTGEQ